MYDARITDRLHELHNGVSTRLHYFEIITNRHHLYSLLLHALLLLYYKLKLFEDWGIASR
jgi:hypothetical protein